MNTHNGDPNQYPPQQPGGADPLIDTPALPLDDPNEQQPAPAAAINTENDPTQPRRHGVARLVGPLATAKARLDSHRQQRAEQQERTKKQKELEQHVQETLTAAKLHRRGGTEQNPSRGQTQAVNATVTLIRSYRGLNRQGEAAKELRNLIYRSADATSLPKYSDAAQAQKLSELVASDNMERRSQNPNDPLNPANVLALRAYFVNQAVTRESKTAKQLGRDWSSVLDEMTRGQALMALSTKGVHALTLEQQAKCLRIDPKTLEQQLRNHQVPHETAIMLDRLNFMIRVDAAALLDNQAQNRKIRQDNAKLPPNKQQPEIPEAQSPLDLLLPDDPKQRSSALNGAQSFIATMPTLANGQQRAEASNRGSVQVNPDIQETMAQLAEKDGLAKLRGLSRDELQERYDAVATLVNNLASSGARGQELAPYQSLAGILNGLLGEKDRQATEEHRKKLEEDAGKTRQATEKMAKAYAELLDRMKNTQNTPRDDTPGAAKSDPQSADPQAKESPNFGHRTLTQDGPQGQRGQASEPPTDDSIEATWREATEDEPEQTAAPAEAQAAQQEQLVPVQPDIFSPEIDRGEATKMIDDTVDSGTEFSDEYLARLDKESLRNLSLATERKVQSMYDDGPQRQRLAQLSSRIYSAYRKMKPENS